MTPVQKHLAKILDTLYEIRWFAALIIIVWLWCLLPQPRQAVPQAKAEELHFGGAFEAKDIRLPFKQKKTVFDKSGLLATACDGDKKCVCINDAIFRHDSSWATAGVGKRAKNPCNLRPPSTWEPEGMIGKEKGAVGYFAKFDSLESGVNACVTLYKKFYHDLPPKKLVKIWTDGGGDRDYHAAVSSCYTL